MYALGYSLDNLSLMALTLSVGFVVDDAIVMLENIVRHIERGESAVRGGAEGVEGDRLHDPLDDDLARGGLHPDPLHGRHHRTALPRVRRHDRRRDPRLGLRVPVADADAVQPVPEVRPREGAGPVLQVEREGLRLVARPLRAHARSGAAPSARWSSRMSAVVLAATGWLFVKIPKGFLPTEDQGLIFGSTEAAQGIGFPAMREKQLQIMAIVRAHPDVSNVLASAGPRGNTAVGNAGIILAQLKPRGRAQEDGRPDRRGAAAAVREGAGHPRVPAGPAADPPRRQPHARASTSTRCRTPTRPSSTSTRPILEQKIRALPEVQDVTSDLQLSNPQLNVTIDRDRASALGISTQKIEDALYTAYGTRQISTIYAPNNQYQVIMELAPEFQASPSAIGMLYVRSAKGDLVPLSSLGSVTQGTGPLTVAHQGQLPAVSISFNLRPGVALGDAVAAVERVARQTLPATVQRELPGHGAGVPELAAGARAPAARRDPRDLHRARDPLRELHPPAHDPDGAAVRRVRRARDAHALPHGALDLRVRRHHPARRPRQEERHHDGRLRDRGAARARA